jgi:hypothetical protein
MNRGTCSVDVVLDRPLSHLLGGVPFLLQGGEDVQQNATNVNVLCFQASGRHAGRSYNIAPGVGSACAPRRGSRLLPPRHIAGRFDGALGALRFVDR